MRAPAAVLPPETVAKLPERTVTPCEVVPVPPSSVRLPPETPSPTVRACPAASTLPLPPRRRFSMRVSLPSVSVPETVSTPL